MIALATEKHLSFLFEAPECWIALPDHGEYAWVDGKDYIWAQIRAICIALDAEVAEHEVVRAPTKLNRKREKAGKVPIPDHYVVDLSRRHRISNSSTSGEGSKKRLHFRRGHWRHYDGFKTWVRWCLVGNPDLGFVSKDYSI